MIFYWKTLNKYGLEMLERCLCHPSSPLVTLPSPGLAKLSSIVASWTNMGQTWAVVFKFLETSLMLEAENDCAAIYSADVVAYNNITESYLEVRIYIYTEV